VGWRIAFTIFAAAVFLIVVPMASLFLRHRPQDMGLLPDGIKQAPEGEPKAGKGEDLSIVDHEWASVDWTLPRAFKTHRLWLLLGVALMLGIIVNFPQVHQVAYITDKGYSSMFAVITFSIFGLLNGIGPLGGLISDRIGREMSATLGAASIITSMAVALSITGAGMEWAWYISSVSYGLGIGLIAPTLPATYGDVFAGRNLGSIIGFINMGFGLGGAVGPYIAGYIYDVNKSYSLAFVMVLVAACIVTTLLWLAGPRKVRLVTGRTPKRAVSQ
jgi:MFS family permease